jgi:hypothetical protein
MHLRTIAITNLNPAVREMPSLPSLCDRDYRQASRDIDTEAMISMECHADDGPGSANTFKRSSSWKLRPSAIEVSGRQGAAGVAAVSERSASVTRLNRF